MMGHIKRINTDMYYSFSSFFNLITESKFRHIPETVSAEAVRIANLYKQETEKITPAFLKQLKKIGLDPVWKEYFKEEEGEIWFLAKLTETKIYDLRQHRSFRYNVYVAFGKDNAHSAVCDTENKVIIIYDDSCRFIADETLTSIIVHEITHGFQQQKEYSTKYKKILDNKKKATPYIKDALYYKEPIEFDAFMTQLSFVIKSQYKKIQKDISRAKLAETKSIMNKRLQKFLLELKVFINSPFATYFVHKELTLPPSLETFELMMQHIWQKPKLWKKFKSKMLNLYNELSSEE